MKKKKVLILTLVIMGFILCTLGISISSTDVNAGNNITEMKFKRVKSLYVPASYSNDYYNAIYAGKSTADKYNTVQSFVHTKDRYAFMLTNTERDIAYKGEANMLYIMFISTKKEKGISL